MLRSDRGFALVIVLWALGVITILAAVFAKRLHTETLVARNQIQLARAQAVADGGVLVMAGRLAGLRQALAPIETPEGPTYVATLRCRIDAIELAVLVEDEAGKVDLNAASDHLLGQLLVGFGLDPVEADRTVDRIVDFRDGDDLKRLNGAEGRDYRMRSQPPPKNAPFEAVAELEQVLDLPADVFARVRPFLTVSSHGSGIDPDVSDQRLLAALTRGAVAAARTTSADTVEPAVGLAPDLITRSPRRSYTVWAISRDASHASFVRQASVELIDRPVKPFIVTSWTRGLGDEAATALRVAFEHEVAPSQDCRQRVDN